MIPNNVLQRLKAREQSLADELAKVQQVIGLIEGNPDIINALKALAKIKLRN